ncbi:MAG: hypothetical protein JWQ95_6020 [Sphaerisporangium sp.]|jgi:hypothetical protein|nr:hypothetical protein [Sphaerisporangium sp.]
MPHVPAWAWIAWAVASLGVFAALETVALANRRTGDTLSENIRRWLGIHPYRPVRRYAVPAFAVVLLGFVAWFVPHILLSIW